MGDAYRVARRECRRAQRAVRGDDSQLDHVGGPRLRVVRWGSQEGYPLIGAAIGIPWHGSRIIIDGGGAGGGLHLQWMVDWATDRTLIMNTGARALQSSASITGYP